MVPGRIRRAGRTSASHVRRVSSCGSSSSTSAAPPPGRVKARRAGITRVSLTTTRSPRRSTPGQVADVAMVGGRRRAAVDEQAGRVAGLDGLLGDARRVEVVVEILQAHPSQARDGAGGSAEQPGRPPRIGAAG